MTDSLACGIILFIAALALGLIVGYALGLVRARKLTSAPVCLNLVDRV